MKTGIYTYKKRNFDGTFQTNKMPVEILDEHGTTYHIRFLHVHADGRGFGTITWVQKKHVWCAIGARSLQKKQYYLPYYD